MVRVWPDELPLRGRVEHVASGAATTFVGHELLLGFLAERVDHGAGGEAGDVTEPDHPAP